MHAHIRGSISAVQFGWSVQREMVLSSGTTSWAVCSTMITAARRSSRMPQMHFSHTSPSSPTDCGYETKRGAPRRSPYAQNYGRGASGLRARGRSKGAIIPQASGTQRCSFHWYVHLLMSKTKPRDHGDHVSSSQIKTECAGISIFPPTKRDEIRCGVTLSGRSTSLYASG